MITFSNWSLLIIVLILHPAHIVNFVNKITHYIPTEENITQSFNQKGPINFLVPERLKLFEGLDE